MTNIAISQLPVAPTATTADLIPIVQSGVTSQLTNAALFTNSTLVTPKLGAPQSGTLTNCTGLPVASGISGFGSGIATFLATPTSANLAAAVTDETGSGSLVFATLPTFAGLKYSGLIATSAAAPTIASATTIAPTTSIVFISGTTAINTITAPTPISAAGGQITLIPTGIFTTTTAGNIALASTAVVGKALIMTFDATASKWYPSY